MKTAFLYPGQGSQFIGMGKDLCDNFSTAKEVFEEVNDALDQDLARLMFSGDEADLALTANTQPALMAVSIATQRVIEQESGKSLSELAQFVAGHSLGEYSALCAAGSISLSDTARLLRIRGNAMQEAVPAGQGAMAALIGADTDTASEICDKARENLVLEVANDNGGGQVVISGSAGAIAKAEEVAADYSLRKFVKLNVSAPFHCSMMQNAADAMQAALAEVEIKAPSVPVVANVIAEQNSDASKIAELLVSQVTGQVRWRESVEYLGAQGVNKAFEIGAGKVLSGLVKRINKEISSTPVGSVEQVKSYIETL